MKQKKFSLVLPKGYSKGIHASVIGLTLFGLFMIISATVTKDATSSQSLINVIVKEVAFIALSYFVMVYFARNYKPKLFDKLYPLFLFLLIAILFAPLLFSGVGDTRAWIRISSVSIQPSEFAKVGTILIMSRSLGDRKNQGLSASQLLTHPIFVVSLIVMIVVFIQKDFGTGLIILGIAVFCSFVPSHRSLYRFQIWFFLLSLIALSLMFLSVTPLGISIMNGLHLPQYMINRFRVSFDPFFDRYDASMQILNGLAAFVQGGLFGVGYGKGFIKYSYIFAVESDSILASVVEELGVVFGFLPIMVGTFYIIFELMKQTLYIMSEKDRIILVGTIAYFFFHFFLNVGGVTALIPLTGVPLLFISAGGSSRLAIMIAIGLCQNVIARNVGTVRLKRGKV